MRLRLFHQVFVLISAAVLVVALSMALVLALNLRNGFRGYLAARDVEELDRFVSVAEARLAQAGGGAALADRRVTLPSLLRDLAAAEGRPAWRGPPPPPPGADRLAPPPWAGAAPPDDRMRPAGGRAPPPEDFGARLSLYDAAGIMLAGPPVAPGARSGGGPSRLIHCAGRVVATVRLIPRGPVPTGVDARFLVSQYRGAALLAVLLLVLGALPAWGIARAATRRLGVIHAATDSIARGDLGARIALAGGDEVADMGRNINRMAESLERLDTARRRWLAQISHELRTPLASLRGELDALEDGLRPLNARAVASLNEDAHRLSRLVDDLHLLAVADLAALPCHCQGFDAIARCGAVLARFAPQAARAGIACTFSASNRVALPVCWDPDRIDQLLGNLITNALRYTDAPGQLMLSLGNGGDAVTLRIEDSAPGVPPAAIARIFEPLYRIDEARDRGSGGSGLGLAVCAAIVAAHRGTIRAEASPLGGLAVVITLPKRAGVIPAGAA